MSDWIDVQERMPVENVAVLVAVLDSYGTRFVDIDERRRREWDLHQESIGHRVTHWMPAPDLPPLSEILGA